MKILVTGSEGSLMQSVIPKLVEKGHEVTGVDNLSRYGKRPGHAQCKYDFIQADLIDSNICHNMAYGHDAIIHGAALIFGVGGFHDRCADILGRDVTLTTNMLRAATDHESVKRFIYISSSMVYERCDSSEESLLDSSDVYKVPVTDYGLSKYMGERLCKAYFNQYGLPYTIWRPFNIITPYEKASNEIGVSHVFADFIKNIVDKKMNPLPIIGDGEQIRCFTWIDDISQCIADYSFTHTTRNDHFNLGRVEPITMKDLARMIYSIAYEKNLIDSNEKLEFNTIKEYTDDVRVRIPSVDKAKAILGWESNTFLYDALKRCVK